MRFPLPSLRRHQRGATAIEYAIIAGLIGLGLVGSLVTTRGSLSAVFGTASSQMASGTSGGAGSAPTIGIAAWSNKTLVGPPTKTVFDANMTYWTFDYTDGSQAVFYRGGGGGTQNVMNLTDKVTNANDYFRFNLDGSPLQYTRTQYANGRVSEQSYSNTGQGAEFGGSPPTVLTQGVKTYTNGTMTADTILSAPTQSFKDQAAATIALYGYFAGMSK